MPKQRSETTGAKLTKTLEWAAGVFEGEGSMTHRADGNWQIEMNMTDHDVMWDFYEAMSCRGNLSGERKPPSAKEHYKPFWVWKSAKRDTIFDIVLDLYPYMGQRRREKMDQFIAWYEAKK